MHYQLNITLSSLGMVSYTCTGILLCCFQDQYEMAHRCVRELFQQHVEALEGNIYANFEPQKDVRIKSEKTFSVSSLKDNYIHVVHFAYYMHYV